jgi:hypothetical protein
MPQNSITNKTGKSHTGTGRRKAVGSALAEVTELVWTGSEFTLQVCSLRQQQERSLRQPEHSWPERQAQVLSMDSQTAVRSLASL